MGNTNFWCCKNKITEKEVRFNEQIDDNNDISFAKTSLNIKNKKFSSWLNQGNVINYFKGNIKETEYKIEREKMEEFIVDKDDIIRAEKIYIELNNTENFNYLISKYSFDDDDTLKNFMLKIVDLNFCEENQIFASGDSNSIKKIQFNRDNLKELVILRRHPNKFITRPLGYFHSVTDNKIFIAYEHYQNSLEYFISNKSLDFVNKMKILKNILELAKFLQTEGLFSLDLNIRNLRFTKKYLLKFCSLENSFDINSDLEFTKFTKFISNKHIHLAPEIVLERFHEASWLTVSWSIGIIISMLFSDRIFEYEEKFKKIYEAGSIPSILYEGIENIFIRCMVLGILRIEPYERPSLIDIIDVYNELLEKLKDNLHDVEILKLRYEKEDFESNIY
jgi:hypothetical protein